MRRIQSICLLVSLFAWPNPVWPVEKLDSCVECHKQLEGSVRGAATLFVEEDVHLERGLSCVDCHGGDPTSMEMEGAMDPARGFLGKPARQDIPQFCARCHADPSYMRRYNPNLPTDQYLKYLTSQHGKKNSLGDKDVAVCTSCHEAHGIRGKRDPFSAVFPTNIPGTCATCHTDAAIMQRHGLSVTQHWEYSQSVHGQALLFRGDRAAPHCASCHGSHEAARPGVIAVGNVCAQCHSLTRDLFAKSRHKEVHAAMGLPECEVCHGNHLIQRTSDEMLGTGPGALCIRCHEPDSQGYVTAQQMREAIESLKAQLASAESLVDEASQLGMDMADAEFKLHEAAAKLTQARTYVHSFSVEQLRPIAEEGLRHTHSAKQQGTSAIQEFHFRRQGFWVTLVILGLLVVGLTLKIRDLESRKAADKSPSSPPPTGAQSQ